jgi:molybdopterin molybdotransferase
LLASGRRLGGVEIAVLAAAGVREVRVRAPRLRLACARRAGDTVIDAAIACIGDAIGSQGGVATLAEQGDVADVLAHADADAVVVVGGTGSGRRDTTVRTLASMGEVLVHGIALLPGETTALGTVGARPVLALPGRLDAALAAWHLLGRSMLARLAGNRETLPMRTAWLTHKVSSPVGFSELVPVRCKGVSASPIASGYVPLAALAQANGWVFIPAESEGHPAQSEVVVRPWP